MNSIIPEFNLYNLFKDKEGTRRCKEYQRCSLRGTVFPYLGQGKLNVLIRAAS